MHCMNLISIGQAIVTRIKEGKISGNRIEAHNLTFQVGQIIALEFSVPDDLGSGYKNSVIGSVLGKQRREIEDETEGKRQVLLVAIQLYHAGNDKLTKNKAVVLIPDPDDKLSRENQIGFIRFQPSLMVDREKDVEIFSCFQEFETEEANTDAVIIAIETTAPKAITVEATATSPIQEAVNEAAISMPQAQE